MNERLRLRGGSDVDRVGLAAFSSDGLGMTSGVLSGGRLRTSEGMLVLNCDSTFWVLYELDRE